MGNTNRITVIKTFGTRSPDKIECIKRLRTEIFTAIEPFSVKKKNEKY